MVLDGERVAELNEHVWDTIERVYLCRITAPPIPIKKKKRRKQSIVKRSTKQMIRECSLALYYFAVATFDSTDSNGDDGIYRNSGVAPKMEPDTTGKSTALDSIATEFKYLSFLHRSQCPCTGQ